MHLGGRIYGGEGETRIIAYVVSGIGFLGAGVILKEGLQIRGLNTAATLWGTAAVGACAGAGLYAGAAAVTVFVLGGNTLLRPLVDFINRLPVSPDQTEALYRVHVTCQPANVSQARDLLYEELELHHYPIQDIDTLSESEEVVELAASLVPTTADPHELDIIVQHLERSDAIDSATWTVSTLS